MELEIKFWELDKGLAKIDTLTNQKNLKKLEELLESTPKIDPKKQHTSLKNWKKLEPLTVKEIIENSTVPIDLDSKNIYFSSQKYDDATVIG